MTPERQACAGSDARFAQVGWAVQNAHTSNIHVARDVAIRTALLKSVHGFADCLLHDGKAAGGIEAEKQGFALTRVAARFETYAHGLPAAIRPTAAAARRRCGDHTLARSDSTELHS